MKFSVIITNYNYARFLDDVIGSVLSQDYPHKEVIVIDDGSSDNSAEILKRYENTCTVIFQKNQGQGAGMNAGYSRATGDFIHFLDADDRLCPGALTAIAKRFGPGISRVQSIMQFIDGDGRVLPRRAPDFMPPTEKITLDTYAQTGSFFAPPHSGNTYSRQFLDNVMPLDSFWSYSAPDTCLITLSAAYGDAAHISQPFTNYRVHGKNISEASGIDISKIHIRVKTGYEADQQLATHALKNGKTYTSGTGLMRSSWHLKSRMYSLCYDPANHMFKNDNRLILMLRGAWSAFNERYKPWNNRIKSPLFFIIFGLTPRFVLRKYGAAVYSSSARASLIKTKKRQ